MDNAESVRPRRPRWFMGAGHWNGPKGVTQVPLALKRVESVTVPEPILRLASAEYDRQFSGQPYERIQERGGFSLMEVINLLADALERQIDGGDGT